MSLSVAIFKAFLFLITHVRICVQSVIWGSGQKRVWDLLKPVTNSCKHPNVGSRNQTQDF